MANVVFLAMIYLVNDDASGHTRAIVHTTYECSHDVHPSFHWLLPACVHS